MSPFGGLPERSSGNPLRGFAQAEGSNRHFCFAKVALFRQLQLSNFREAKVQRAHLHSRFAVTFAHKIFDFVSKSVPFGGCRNSVPLVATLSLLHTKSPIL